MQNSGYSKKDRSNRITSLYVDGNNAVIPEEMPAYPEPSQIDFETERRKIKARERRTELKKRRLRQIRARRIAAVSCLGGMFVAVCLVMLNCMITNNSLTSEISALESELSELTAQNDSREYDIDSSVDINEVIQVATEELGMVRSSAGQVITYETSDTEYIQQLAQVPTD